MMPDLSYHYGLTPAEVWGMPLSQFEAYTRHLRRLAREGQHGA
jgi:hypothetical protein